MTPLWLLVLGCTLAAAQQPHPRQVARVRRQQQPASLPQRLLARLGAGPRPARRPQLDRRQGFQSNRQLRPASAPARQPPVAEDRVAQQYRERFQPEVERFQPQTEQFQPQVERFQAERFQPEAERFQPEAERRFQPEAERFQPQTERFQPEAERFQPEAELADYYEPEPVYRRQAQAQLSRADTRQTADKRQDSALGESVARPHHQTDLEASVHAAAAGYTGESYADAKRLAFQIHGQGGPHSYRFGYDTGVGYNRQFRYEERDAAGVLHGRYGYYDQHGKLQVVNYTADPVKGFHAEGEHVPKPQY